MHGVRSCLLPSHRNNRIRSIFSILILRNDNPLSEGASKLRKNTKPLKKSAMRDLPVPADFYLKRPGDQFRN